MAVVLEELTIHTSVYCMQVSASIWAPVLHQNILHALKPVHLFTRFCCQRRMPFTAHDNIFRTLQLVINIPSLGFLFVSSLTFYISLNPLRSPGSKSEKFRALLYLIETAENATPSVWPCLMKSVRIARQGSERW